MKRFWEKVDKNSENGCWEWQGAKSRKYGMFGYNGKNVKAHRLSWIIYNGKIPKKLSVLHKCDNPSCVNPRHLFLGTQSDNIRDCIKKKRRLAKLTPEKVRTIRELYKCGDISHARLAKQFGVALYSIFCVIHNKTWKHIT